MQHVHVLDAAIGGLVLEDSGLRRGAKHRSAGADVRWLDGLSPGTEEEQLVLPDRSADAAAEVVQLDDIPRQ